MNLIEAADVITHEREVNKEEEKECNCKELNPNARRRIKGD